MEQRHIKRLRLLINISLISLLLGAVLSLLSALLGTFYSLLLGAATIGITYYCYRRADGEIHAGRDYYLWRYTPTLLFIGLPVLYYLISFSDGSWSGQTIIGLMHVGTSYLLPMACLLYAERMVRRYIY